MTLPSSQCGNHIFMLLRSTQADIEFPTSYSTRTVNAANAIHRIFARNMSFATEEAVTFEQRYCLLLGELAILPTTAHTLYSVPNDDNICLLLQSLIFFFFIFATLSWAPIIKYLTPIIYWLRGILAQYRDCD